MCEWMSIAKNIAFLSSMLLPQVFAEGSSVCVAVQMHNLQHKFLRCARHRDADSNTAPSTDPRVSLVQAALFYHHRESADRGDKIGRLLELALGDLEDAEAIGQLMRALRERKIDLNQREMRDGDV